MNERIIQQKRVVIAVLLVLLLSAVGWTNLNAECIAFSNANMENISIGYRNTINVSYGIPTLTTIPVSKNGNDVVSGGNVIDDGGSPITARGICYGSNPNPDLSASYTHTEDGTGAGIFTSVIGASATGTIYVRAYATNATGTAYGDELSVNIDYYRLPRFDYNGLTYVVAPDPQSSSTEFISFNAAYNYCENLTAYGYSDWVMPNISELETMWQNRSSIGGFNSYTYMCYHSSTYYGSTGHYKLVWQTGGRVQNANLENVGMTTVTSEGVTATFRCHVRPVRKEIFLPIVTTDIVTDITQHSAVLGGNVTDDGGATVTARGICWGTSPNPTISNSIQVGSGTGHYTTSYSSLTPGTQYFVRAYATNIVGTAYGNEVSFTTPPISIPTVTTNSVFDITTTTAKGGGNVINNGGTSDGITERGICWSTNHNPTTYNSHVSDYYYSWSYYNSGSYTLNMTGLIPGTQYYVRAYATNSEGTAYGDEVSFITNSPPTVTTNSVTNITPNSATCGGNVTAEGSGAVTARGVCWSTSPNPTTSNSHTSNGTGTGSFTSNLTGLNQGTLYYVRAYATNSEGTAYGDEVSFTTICTHSVTTNNVSYITQTSATCGGYVTIYNGTTVTERGVCWSTSNQSPTLSDSHTSSGSGSGVFTSNLTGLTQNTTYYVRAYATSSEGTAYGETKQFKTTKFEYRISEGGVVATSAGGYFYDSGGPNYNYSQNEHYVMTFMSNAGAGTKIQMTFTEFDTYYDYAYLVIYDGMNTSAPLIGTYSYGYLSPGTVTATNSDGALTFVFISTNEYHVGAGWKAAISIVGQSYSYTINTSASPSFGGMVSGGGYYNSGESCTVTAQANDGYVFTNWTENGNVVSTNASYTFTVNSNRSLVANFQAQPQSFTINVSANPTNGGTAVGGGTYNQGASCTVTATANAGFAFVNWTKNGTQVSTNSTYSFLVTESASYVANFSAASPSSSAFQVNAQYYPNSYESSSEYVKVYWSEIATAGLFECFDTGDFSLYDWQMDSSNPWSITTINPYEGMYCMKSGGSGVSNVNSNMIVTIDIPSDGIMSFFGKISCEYGWDYGYFYIDGVQKGCYTGQSNWAEKHFDITAGTHTFQWQYTKDGSIDSNDDCFYVDYITFYRQAQPGWLTYSSEFYDAVGSNGSNTPSWAYEYPASYLCSNYVGWQITKVSLFSDNQYNAVGGNYTCRIYIGGTEPAAGTLVSTINVDVPSNQNDWVDWDLTNPVVVTGNDPIWIVWTANSAVSNWPAGCSTGSNNQGNWWNAGDGNGWTHSSNGIWTMRQWFTNRPLENFCVYRANCDGSGSTIIANNVTGDEYIDIGWSSLAAGNYKYGVCTSGSTNIFWSNCISKPISYQIIASANPLAGGTVTGDGTYVQGAFCILTATANTGYTFANWTENGIVVSTNASYSFTVNGNRNLVANFTANAQNYSISVSANPSTGGEVTGGGSYTQGTTCNVTAMANNGYTFTNWTENNEVVSTNANYSFIVSGNRNLVANFAFSGTITNHWIPESSNYSEIMAMYTVIQIDGVEQYSNMLEVAVFCGNECRGSAIASEFNLTHRYLAVLNVFGENGHQLTFKLYDHSIGQELNFTSPATVTFDVNGYGNPVEPYVLNFTSSITHSQALNSGWNWWSTYIEQDGIDGLGMLENSIGSAGVRIQGRNGTIDQFEYQGSSYWYGSLTSIENEQMYKIRTNAACNAVMVGQSVLPANHPININGGWNWIGFPCNQSVSVNDAMSGFTPVANDVIKGRNGSTTYVSYGSTSLWYGTLNTLEPGQGYMYKSNSNTSKTLIFQTGRGEETVTDVTEENSFFTPNTDDFSDNMLVTTVIDLDGQELRSEEYEVAAYVGNECRGSVRLMYVEPFDRYVAFLLVFGEAEEEIHFVLTDGNDVAWSDDLLTYTADGMEGSLTEPATLHFGTLGLNDNKCDFVNVFPNPSNGVFNIEGNGIHRIEVVNAFGQTILLREVENNLMQIDLGDKAAGVYLLRVITNDGITTKQLIKE